jgi:hypothetical protein
MADRILVDAHVRVAPRISVSEGHRVAEQVRSRVRAACPEVLDMLVHIDPEDDLVPAESVATGDINRDALERWLNTEAARVWGHGPWAPERIQLHYLNGQVEVEVMLPPMPGIDPEPVVIAHGLRDLQKAAQQAGLPLLSWTVYRRLSAD